MGGGEGGERFFGSFGDITPPHPLPIEGRGNSPSPPPAILRARLELPPVEPVAVADRHRRIVFLDPPLHLLEQLVDQRPVRLRPGLEIGILGLEVGEHLLVGDVGVALVAKPGVWVFDRDPVMLVFVRALFGPGRHGRFGGLVHGPALSAPSRDRKPGSSGNLASAMGGKRKLASATSQDTHVRYVFFTRRDLRR